MIGLGLAGRRDEARARLEAMRATRRVPAFESWIGYLMAWLDRRSDEVLGGLSVLGGLKIQDDPEAIFQEGWLLCDIEEHERGLATIERAVGKGYFVAPTLASARQFDALRGRPAFDALLAGAEANRSRALEAFRRAGGQRLLGV